MDIPFAFSIRKLKTTTSSSYCKVQQRREYFISFVLSRFSCAMETLKFQLFSNETLMIFSLLVYIFFFWFVCLSSRCYKYLNHLPVSSCTLFIHLISSHRYPVPLIALNCLPRIHLLPAQTSLPSTSRAPLSGDLIFRRERGAEGLGSFINIAWPEKEERNDCRITLPLGGPSSLLQKSKILALNLCSCQQALPRLKWIGQKTIQSSL